MKLKTRIEDDTETEQQDKESICAEADRIVGGDRQRSYGHPFQNFTETAQIWQAILGRKLKNGARLTPEDVGRCMIGVKLAREVNHPKRDNLVDMAGYAKTLEMCADYRHGCMDELVRLTEEMGLYDNELHDSQDHSED